jgi:hypothetical protein
MLKAARAGATREEVGEAIAIAIAINGAAIVDRTDIINEQYNLVQNLWGSNKKMDNGADETTP